MAISNGRCKGPACSRGAEDESASAKQPVVDLTNGILNPHRQSEVKPLKTIHKIMRTKLGLAILAGLSLTIGILPLLGYCLVIYLLGRIPMLHWLMRRLIDHTVTAWITMIMAANEYLLGVNVRTFGHGGPFQRRSLLIMNHPSYIDWIYFWSVCHRQGNLTYWKVVASHQPLTRMPILGHCMQAGCYIIINRCWQKDREKFRSILHYFNVLDYPVQLLMFPEGGSFTSNRKLRSDKFAEAKELPKLMYCLYPRLTGFLYSVNALRSCGLDAIYDMTIAFPDYFPKEPQDIFKGAIPREVHFHIKEYKINDIPSGSNDLEEWIQKRWVEKEERLKMFYTHWEYRDSDNITSPEVKRPRNGWLILYSVLLFNSYNVIAFISLWYFPYLTAIFLVINVVFLIILQLRGLDLSIIGANKNNIEEAAQRYDIKELDSEKLYQ